MSDTLPSEITPEEIQAGVTILAEPVTNPEEFL